MTEKDWLNRTQLITMLKHVREAGCPDRKLKLALVGFCRLLDGQRFPPEWREIKSKFEEWLEGSASKDLLDSAYRQLQAAGGFSSIQLVQEPWYFGLRAVDCFIRVLDEPSRLDGLLTEKSLAMGDAAFAAGAGSDKKGRIAYCRLVRDIFGNPFRPVAFDPEWRTSTAVALAKQMHDARDFSAMPILADALQDAGCENRDVLTHCRAPDAIHVRGCWVVDLTLDNERS